MRLRRILVSILMPGALSACGGPASPPPPVAVPAVKPSPPPEPRFVNAAPAAGLSTILYCGGARKDHLLESTGSGTAFVDYDGDGRLDVFLVNAWHSTRSRREFA